MSGTTTTPTARDNILAAAKDVPDAIRLATAADPQLADFLQGKALTQSWTVWVTILTPIVTGLATHYALGWDKDTCAEVAAGLTSLAAIIMRKISSTPITGIFTAAPVAKPGA